MTKKSSSSSRLQALLESSAELLQTPPSSSDSHCVFPEERLFIQAEKIKAENDFGSITVKAVFALIRDGIKGLFTKKTALADTRKINGQTDKSTDD